MTLSKISFVADTATDENDMNSEDDALDQEAEKLVEDALNETEPPLKKVKRDLVKEAEEELRAHDEILKNSELSVDEKFKKVTDFLNSLFENNINTLQFETNFAEWCKSTLLSLVDEVSNTSVEYYDFLCSVLKIAPTIFESVCEKVLSLSFVCHRFSEECDLAYNVFMEKLANTFEKLRRFPKLIAKLLCCVRENIDKLNPNAENNSGKSAKRRKSNVFKSFEVSIKFILSKNFINAYSSIVSMLPAGQISDLWKTLHHNLEEECIKKFDSDTKDSSLYFLLSVVGELIVAFLNNIKVADYAVPSSTVEKVSEMMQRLKEHSLVQIGKEVSRTHDINCTRYFLKLSSAWGNLHQIMVLYSQNYRHELPDVPANFVEAEDLSLLLPYLSSVEWIALWKAIEKSEDNVNSHLMVGLVALKLNWLAMIEQRQRESTEDAVLSENDADNLVKVNLKRSTQATAKFVWNLQHLLIKGGDSYLNMSNESILHIASIYMDHEELVGHAKTYLDSIVLSHASLDAKVTQEVQRYSTITFHVALVMEALHEGLQQVEKMQVMKRRIKKFLQDFLSPAFKISVLQNITKHEKMGSGELQKTVTEAVKVVNDLMSVKLTNEEVNDSSDRPPVLLKGIISFISQQELGQYPKPVKSMIFLGCAVIFTALVDCEDYKDIVEDLVVVLNECGKKSQGNEFLFHIGWDNMFELVRRSVEFLSPESIKRMCSLVLENIHLSPKTTSQFLDKYAKVTCEDFELTTPLGQLSLAVMEYILQEVEETKAKSTPMLLNHAKELTNTAVSKLSDGSVITELHSLIRAFKKQKKKGAAVTNTTGSISFVSHVMHTCYLLLKGKSCMSEEDASEYSVIVLPYLRFALDFLEAGNKTGGDGKMKSDEKLQLATPLFNCRRFSIESLKSFEEFRSKLPDEFLLRMWNCCMMNLKMEDDNYDKEFEKGLLKRLIEVSNEVEFQAICDSIVQQLTNDASELTLAANLLNILMEAEISAENKKPRRMTVEMCLHKYLEHINLWQDSAQVIQVATPYIEFQTKLLRRRKPMGNLNTLAVSMLSITELPLTKVEDVKTFSSLFSLASELMNAMTVHRLDVISYRTHVFLQCFQFLVENLVKKADQTNKLTDGEIYDLRHCGHCIERICQSTKLGRQEFTRVSPYLVVVLLQQFEKITVYPAVKNPLLNGCYKLLDMCDDKGISHVNSMLSAGSREIFKTVYEMYKKFYRYKGKV